MSEATANDVSLPTLRPRPRRPLVAAAVGVLIVGIALAGWLLVRALLPQRVLDKDGQERTRQSSKAGSRGPRLIHIGATSALRSLAFSDDGNWLVCAGRNTSVAVWDLSSGKQVKVIEGPVRAVAISANGDWLVIGGGEGEDESKKRNRKFVHLWNRATGKKVRDFEGHSAPVDYLALSRDNQWLATASRDGTVRLWYVSTGKEERVIRLPNTTEHAAAIHCLALADDGSLVVTGGRDGVARLWDRAAGKELRSFHGHEGPIKSAALSRDGKQLVTAGDDQSARLWNVETGEPIRIFLGHSDRVIGVAITRDGKQVVTGSIDKTAGLWDVATGREIRPFPVAAEVTCLALSNDGQWLAVGDDQMTSLWNVASGAELCRLTSFHDKTWAVHDSTGRYDSADDGDIPGLRWDIAGTREKPPLIRLKEEFYDPGLLAKHLGRVQQPLRQCGEIEQVERSVFPRQRRVED